MIIYELFLVNIRTLHHLTSKLHIYAHYFNTGENYTTIKIQCSQYGGYLLLFRDTSDAIALIIASRKGINKIIDSTTCNTVLSQPDNNQIIITIEGTKHTLGWIMGEYVNNISYL